MVVKMLSILPELSAEINERLMKLSVKRQFSTDELVFAEDDDATFLPIVLDGKIKMVRYPDVGKEVIIGVFKGGEIFAIPPALDGKKFPATAIAMDNSSLLFLPRREFLNLMKESSEFSQAVTNTMCGLLRQRTQTVQILAITSSEQRIASILLRLAQENGEKMPLKITLRRQDIAEMSGLTLETTIRTIRSLAKKEIVNIVHGKIIIKDAETIEEFLR